MHISTQKKDPYETKNFGVKKIYAVKKQKIARYGSQYSLICSKEKQFVVQ